MGQGRVCKGLSARTAREGAWVEIRAHLGRKLSFRKIALQHSFLCVRCILVILPEQAGIPGELDRCSARSQT